MQSTFSAQQIKAAVTALKAYKEKPFISYEWEELVLRLRNDNDPLLRERMARELDAIMEKDPAFKVFRVT
jgi:hypothetical protein